MFANLRLLENINLLECVDLGAHGKEFYKKFVGVRGKKKLKPQVYAAAVFFSVQQDWIN